MANYGKILVPFGFLFIIPGVIIAGTSSGQYGIPPFAGALIAFGLLFMAIGLPRLVQGKDRKVLGQIIRPKAAARSSAIYMLFIFNATPFYLPGSLIMNYTAPQPLSIWFSGYWRDFGYVWLPGVIIGVFIIALLSLILAGKIPKTFHVINNLIILVCFYFWLNFGIQLFLWSFFADQSIIEFYSNEPFLNNFNLQIGLSLTLLLASVLMILRMIKKTGEAFETFYIEGSKKVLIFIVIIASYIGTAFPLYFGYVLCSEVNSYRTSFINYIPFIFIIYIIIKLFTTIIKTIREFSRQRVGSGVGLEGVNFSFSTALYLTIFFFAWAPIVLPLIDSGANNKYNSIYNSDWSGWSNFKDELENQGYEVMCIQSSLSTITSLDSSKQVVLVLPGPNVFYNPASEIPFFLTAYNQNFSMLICGETETTAGTLLWESLVASIYQSQPTPITFFPKGIMHDNYSYWKNPKFPVIQNFRSLNTDPDGNVNVENVVLSYSTSLVPLFDLLWDVVGLGSDYYSYVDVDNDEKFDSTKDRYFFPDAFTSFLKSQGDSNIEIMGMPIGELLEDFGEGLDEGVQLGGYRAIEQISSTSVFARHEVNENSRVFVAGDGSWLNNELTSIEEYDNLQFGLNVIDWLDFDKDKGDVIIVFDEAHIRAESGERDISSAGSFGILQRYVNWLSTNPFLGLAYPLFALNSLRKWIPKEGDKQKVQLKDLEEAERNAAMLKFRTSSFFAQKINWYRKNKKYRLALIQLYRRLERIVNRMLGASAQRDADAILNAIKRERGSTITQEHYNRMDKFFKKMLKYKEGKDEIQDEKIFEEMFMEMSWVMDRLSSR